jgi:hypothetical protein
MSSKSTINDDEEEEEARGEIHIYSCSIQAIPIAIVSINTS